MVRFHFPPVFDESIKNVEQAIRTGNTCGDGDFTFKCNEWIEKNMGVCKSYLVGSGTAALELAAMLVCEPGDEVIVPSFTFVTSASAFCRTGAKAVFVDVRPDTMNIDENLIEDAITDKTVAICPVHYAGVGCEMDKIMEIAQKYNLKVIEDAAQGVMSKYKGKPLGSIGDIGCYSFHETKNYSMGEGGAILFRDDEELADEGERRRESGTNRRRYIRGELDKYTWEFLGSSFLPSELNAAYLLPQLERAEEINVNRNMYYNMYAERLADLNKEGIIELPVIPDTCDFNAHMFYYKMKDIDERTEFIRYMMEDKKIKVMSHYIPLHDTNGGHKYGRFHGEDKYTTKESERLVRLPLYYDMGEDTVDKICEAIYGFYKK
ncbi:MAG: dTDP-4-amino-4,6-dideoxygalactose transaminase [Clostridiales bacterium]|nr:dTDP-4-amino-4,6-dideoxygalactose transaminase [Clostridiales bacterium]